MVDEFVLPQFCSDALGRMVNDVICHDKIEDHMDSGEVQQICRSHTTIMCTVYLAVRQLR